MYVNFKFNFYFINIFFLFTFWFFFYFSFLIFFVLLHIYKVIYIVTLCITVLTSKTVNTLNHKLYVIHKYVYTNTYKCLYTYLENIYIMSTFNNLKFFFISIFYNFVHIYKCIYAKKYEMHMTSIIYMYVQKCLYCLKKKH